MIEGNRLRYRSSRYPKEEQLDEVTGVIYDHFDTDREGKYVEPKDLSYGDYGGSMVERSNYEEFLEVFAEYRSQEWWPWHGGHGSHGIIIRVDADERVPEIGEFVEGLLEYPSANDDRLSELEEEARQVAWVEYGEREFIEKLVELEPELEEPLEEDSTMAINRMYMAVAQAASESPNVEDAAGAVSFRPYMSVLESVADDPDGLMVAFELANQDGMGREVRGLDYLFQELNYKSAKTMPAFYYALLDSEPKAARVLGVLGNAREFADLWMSQDELDDTTILEDAKALGGLLHGRSVEDLRVLSDMIEENPERAIEELDIGA